MAFTWGIAALATVGVIIRPWKLPEAIWAVGGAALIVALGLLPARLAWRGVLEGVDVYLFLTGMMLLSEVARMFGLFDWIAAHAAARALGSPTRLFTLIYGVGVLVTAFLSNDATAVVLTPAVAASVRAAKGRHPLPYLLICAHRRQRRELRAADLQSGQSGHLRQPHAAAAAMAAALCAAVGGRDRGHLSGVAADPARGAAPDDRPRGRAAELVHRGQAGGMRHRCDGGGADGRLGAGHSARAGDLRLRDGDHARRAAARRAHRGAPDAPCWATSPGACCRWWPGCSCWCRRWPIPA